MTRVDKKTLLPALNDSNGLKDADFNDVASKNYTSTILKYANLSVKFPQLNTNSKTVVAAINELLEGQFHLDPAVYYRRAKVGNDGSVLVENDSLYTGEGLYLGEDGISSDPKIHLGGISVIPDEGLLLTDDGLIYFDKDYYKSGTLMSLSNRTFSFNIAASTESEIQQESLNNPNVLFYTEGDPGGGGTTNYNELTNKPTINNITLIGNKTSQDLGLQPAGNYAEITYVDQEVSTKQDKLIAGENITISEDNIISASSGEGSIQLDPIHNIILNNSAGELALSASSGKSNTILGDYNFTSGFNNYLPGNCGVSQGQDNILGGNFWGGNPFKIGYLWKKNSTEYGLYLKYNPDAPTESEQHSMEVTFSYSDKSSNTLVFDLHTKKYTYLTYSSYHNPSTYISTSSQLSFKTPGIFGYVSEGKVYSDSSYTSEINIPPRAIVYPLNDSTGGNSLCIYKTEITSTVDASGVPSYHVVLSDTRSTTNFTGNAILGTSNSIVSHRIGAENYSPNHYYNSIIGHSNSIYAADWYGTEYNTVVGNMNTLYQDNSQAMWCMNGLILGHSNELKLAPCNNDGISVVVGHKNVMKNAEWAGALGNHNTVIADDVKGPGGAYVWMNNAYAVGATNYIRHVYNAFSFGDSNWLIGPIPTNTNFSSNQPSTLMSCVLGTANIISSSHGSYGNYILGYGNKIDSKLSPGPTNPSDISLRNDYLANPDYESDYCNIVGTDNTLRGKYKSDINVIGKSNTIYCSDSSIGNISFLGNHLTSSTLRDVVIVGSYNDTIESSYEYEIKDSPSIYTTPWDESASGILIYQYNLGVTDHLCELLNVYIKYPGDTDFSVTSDFDLTQTPTYPFNSFTIKYVGSSPSTLIPKNTQFKIKYKSVYNVGPAFVVAAGTSASDKKNAFQVMHTGDIKLGIDLDTTAQTVGAAINELYAGGGGGGTTDYNVLSNKPRINNIELTGNKSLSDLGIDLGYDEGEPGSIDFPKDSITLGSRTAGSTIGTYSIVQGQNNSASEFSSVAFGLGNGSSAQFSFVQGQTNQIDAYSQFSHAEGNTNKLISSTHAHAEGNYNTITSSYASHTEGSFNKIQSGSTFAHAEGGYNEIKEGGQFAHVEGLYNIINSGSQGAHAEGYYTKANGNFQHVEGKVNVLDEDKIFAHIVGNGTVVTSGGTTTLTPSNAYTLDWEGNGWFAGKVSAEGEPVGDNDLIPLSYLKQMFTVDEVTGELNINLPWLGE